VAAPSPRSSPRLSPLERALERIGARPVPFFVFLASAAALAVLQHGTLRAVPVRAVAVGEPLLLASPAQAVVGRTHVRPGDRVELGTPLATLDDRFVRRELELVDAELFAATREAELAQLALVEEVARERREGLRRVGEAKAASGRAKAEEEARARLLQAIAAQTAEIRARHEARLAGEADVRDAARRLAEGEASATEASALARSEVERLRALETTLPRDGLPPLARATAELHEARLAALRARRAQLVSDLGGLVVLAPGDGRVVRVAPVGTALAPGATVAELAPELASELVAYLPPETPSERLGAGATLLVAIPGCNGETELRSDASAVVEAPPWLAPALRETSFGLPVRAPLPPGCRLVPGRVVAAELRAGATGAP